MKMKDEILYQPPSLLEICKKHIMEKFEIDDVIKMKEIVPPDMDDVIKMKEIVPPDMKFFAEKYFIKKQKKFSF